MSDAKPNLDSLFAAASEMESAEERTAFLDRSCGDNVELRLQVEQLLRSDERAGRFMEDPPEGVEETIVPNASGDDRGTSLEAGLSAAFWANEAVLVGDKNHSVMKMLGKTINVPHVALRESEVEGDGPIERPNSAEIPSQQTDSRYQLQGEIARGGMGAIIRGRDTDLGRDLAIKVLLDSHKNNPDVIQRFVEEAQIGGQLQHPGIAPIYELGQFADRRPFFSMKLVKGQTLSKLLAEREDASEDRARFLGIFEQVCQTMAYAHSRGVIHRDLKPANIMVGAFGEVQVMDWGLAKVLPAGGVADEKKAHNQQQGQSIIQTLRSGVGSDVPAAFGSTGSDTLMGSVMGTPAYMPPEQALGEIDNLDERADVFGLGAILCEILTGQPPYVGDDGTQVYRMASRGKLAECLERLDTSGVDEDLIEIAKRCLQLEPCDRPRHAGVLAEKIIAYLEAVETRLRETEKHRAVEAAQVVEQKRRLRTTVALSGAMVLVLGCGIAATAWQAYQAEEARVAEAERAEGERLAKQEAYKQELLAKERAKELRRRSYAAEVNLAFQAFDEGNLARTRVLLERQTPSEEEDLRGFEWRHLWALSRGDQLEMLTTNASLADAEYSADGRLIALAHADDHVVVRDAMSKKIVKELPSRSSSVAFSPDGKLLAAPDGQGVVQLYETDTWEQIHGLKTRFPLVFATEYSPDGAWIAVSGERGVEVWNTATWELHGHCPGEPYPIAWHLRNAVAFSPDSRLLATPTEAGGPIQVWDLSDLTKPKHEIVDTASTVTTTKFLAEPTRLLLGGFDGSLTVADLESGELSKPHQEHQGWLTVIDTDGGNTFMTCSSDRTVVIWDSQKIQSLARLRGHLAEVWALAMSPVQDRAITGSQDGTIMFWDSDRRPEASEIDGSFLGFYARKRQFYAPASAGEPDDHSKSLSGASMFDVPENPNGNAYPALIAEEDDGLSIWDVATLTRESLWEGLPRAPEYLAFSDNGQFAASFVGGQLEVWNAADGHSMKRLKLQGRWRTTKPKLCISNDSRRVAFSGVKPLVVLWGKEGHRVLELGGHQENETSSVAFSPDGNLLATGTAQSNEVVLWEIPTGKLLARLRGHLQGVPAIGFSPDGKTLASGSHDGKLKLWNVSTRQEIVSKSLDGVIRRLRFSPDGETLAVDYAREGRPRVRFIHAAPWADIEKAESGHKQDESGQLPFE